jgi:hypothetical protein
MGWAGLGFALYVTQPRGFRLAPAVQPSPALKPVRLDRATYVVYP